MPRLPWDVIGQIIGDNYVPPVDRSLPTALDLYTRTSDLFASRIAGMEANRAALLVWTKVRSDIFDYTFATTDAGFFLSGLSSDKCSSILEARTASPCVCVCMTRADVRLAWAFFFTDDGVQAALLCPRLQQCPRLAPSGRHRPGKRDSCVLLSLPLSREAPLATRRRRE